MSVFMPEVDLGSDFSTAVAEARKQTSGPGDPAREREVAIITPGRLIMGLPCPAQGSVAPQMVAGIRAIVPEEQPQDVTAIAFNDVVKRGALDASKVNELIPFTGYLIGMAYVGHSVIVFEGHPSALAAGCRDADLLIVDGAMAGHLQEDWVVVAARAMRNPRILLFGRDGKVMLVDPSTERWPRTEGSPEPKKRKWWPF